MMKFKSRMFEDILVEGIINLKAERNFKWFGNFELTVYDQVKELIKISTSTNFLKFDIEIKQNSTDYRITIPDQSRVIFNEDIFDIKVNKMYLLNKKYADILVNNHKFGEVIFEKKLLNTVLDFVPNKDFEFEKETYLKIAILILINIANLDGSE